MWISPDGEIPEDTTTGRPDAIAASAATSAQCRAAVSLVVIMDCSGVSESAARYIGVVENINPTVLS
jgi:hypothetical protein